MLPVLLAEHASFTQDVSGGQAMDAFVEVPTASGIPDVMFVGWDQGAVQEREQLGLTPVLSLTHLRVLVRLTTCPASVLELSTASGVSAAHLRRTVLPDLAERGWIDLGAPTLALRAGILYRPPARTLVSVEAKLSNWSQAFTQAVRHVPSADQSYIALDARRARTALQYAHDMADEGVGVATVDAADATVRIVSRPTVRRQRSAQFLLAAEQTWHLHRQGLASGPTGHVFGRDLQAAQAADVQRLA